MTTPRLSDQRIQGAVALDARTSPAPEDRAPGADVDVDAVAPRRRAVPDDQFGGRLRGTYFVDLDVVRVDDLAPHIRAITFGSPDLVEFSFVPGQDLMIEFPVDDRFLRRRYTIRRANPAAGTAVIEFELHGNGVAARWAANAAVSDALHAIGPRGAMALHEAARSHVFVADDSATPATFAMLEALSPDTTAAAIIVTPNGENSRPGPASAATVVWVHPTELDNAIAQLHVDADTVAYVNGERHLVRDAVEQLSAAGVHPDRISSKSYWRRDQPNPEHGEPAKV
jgi:NADPH-dependent ferric siderophore reductase